MPVTYREEMDLPRYGAVVEREHRSLIEYSQAVYSPCETYRYLLVRTWGNADDIANFLMLNPSTATELKNDPTLARCQRRSVAWGMGGFAVTNAYALRSTDPKGLRRVEDPVGPLNDQYIIYMAQRAKRLILAWGRHATFQQRGAQVLELLEREGLLGKAEVLALNDDGSPAHPLMLGYNVQPVPWLQTA
jgi:hypothetical protein